MILSGLVQPRQRSAVSLLGEDIWCFFEWDIQHIVWYDELVRIRLTGG